MVTFFDHISHVRMRQVTKVGNESKKAIEDKKCRHQKDFGIVHVRTDGELVPDTLHSGKPGQKESYAFQVDEQGEIAFEEKTKVM
jgi:hypothetical protein